MLHGALLFGNKAFISVQVYRTKITEPFKMQTFQKKITLNCCSHLLVLNKPAVMGIINTTPDSFFAGSRHQAVESAVEQAGCMLAAGARILDIGGYSTRPGAAAVTVEEELSRVIPVIAAIHQSYPQALISIDTFRASVATEAVRAGACMVNDVSAGEDDPEMIKTVAALKVPYIIMHKKGTPQTMQVNPHYDDVVLEVIDYLRQRIELCKEAGIADIIIDPGFGFGKNLEHNYRLFASLQDLSIFGVPVLVGVSRKSMIQKLLHVDTAHALNGTTALHALALTKGADILRVHDVAEAMECIAIVNAVNGII
jgi:dihydropteroate synthase